jgi:hypothetical protein
LAAGAHHERLALALAFGCAGLALHCGSFGDATASPDAGVVPEGGSPADAAPRCAPETDFARDAKNCGRCGRDCGAGPCASGTCGSYVLVEPTLRPWYLAVDDDPNGDVYWTSFANPVLPGGDGAIRRVSKMGGPVTVVADATADAYDVAVQGDRLVFTSLAHEIRGVPRGGGTLISISAETGSDLARSGSSLFFTGRAANLGGVFELTTGSAMGRASFAVGYSPEGIGVDADYVFWANHNGSDGATQGGSIGRVRRNGTNPEVEWTPGQKAARRIAVGGGYVYWTSDLAGTVSRKAVGGTDVEPVYAGNIRYGSVIVDAANEVAYITAELENTLLRVGLKAGSTPTVLETGLDNPVGLAQDATAIYFTERNGNRIRRLVK